MKPTLRTAHTQPVYPWLLGIYPILHLYTENLGLVVESEVIPSILLMLVGTAVFFRALKRLVRKTYLTAFITAVCVIGFSLSGHTYELVFMPRSLAIWTILMLLGLAAACIWLRKTGSEQLIGQLAPSFNAIALVLLAFQLISLAAGLIEFSKYIHVYAKNIPGTSLPQSAPKAMDSATRPDIYFIVPDGYPSDSWMKSTEGYDNSDFTKALEDRGFTVVGHAQSNYAITNMSLPSILNMQYYQSNPSPYSDRDFLRLETANSKVARHLAEIGYTYIQLLSGSFIPSTEADIVRDFTPQGAIEIDIDNTTLLDGLLTRRLPLVADLAMIERSYKHSFFEAYMDTTLLRLARSRLGKLLQNAKSWPYHTSAPERFLETIDEVISISSVPEATFTIVHLLKPHTPVVFNERGEPIPWNSRPAPEEFFAELRFVNSRFLHMIDSILARSKNPPIIIFQADHGSILGMGTGPDRLTLFDIYGAYYLPPQFSVDFPKPYTTVNTFSLILNSVFGSEFEIQIDRLFEHPKRHKAPFVQADVTQEFLN